MLSGQEFGDLWHVPGGFLADLTIRDAEGTLLSENHYDLNEEEIQRFFTSVYPPAPTLPVNATVLHAEQATKTTGMVKQSGLSSGYSKVTLGASTDGGDLRFEFAANVREDGNYFIRLSANSGSAARQLGLSVDGVQATLENYPGLDATQRITREVHPVPELSWYPGWHMHLSKGMHHLVFSGKESQAVSALVLDAVSLQRYKELPDPM